MLLLGSKLINIPVMSLQTGTKLASTKSPVINPANLQILAYEVEGSILATRPAYIRIADVRELGNIGMIIDSSDEFVGLDDVISLKKIIDLGFSLVGLNVIDEHKHKLGKVFDYSLDSNDFIIRQINVKRGLFKSFSETELLIYRSQIVEINDKEIIVKSAAKKLEPIEKNNLSYLNPFRSTTTTGSVPETN